MPLVMRDTRSSVGLCPKTLGPCVTWGAHRERRFMLLQKRFKGGRTKLMAPPPSSLTFQKNTYTLSCTSKKGWGFVGFVPVSVIDCWM